MSNGKYNLDFNTNIDTGVNKYINRINDAYNKIKGKLGEPLLSTLIVSAFIFIISHVIDVSKVMVIILISIGAVYFINEYRNKMTTDFNNKLSNIATRSKNYRQILAHKVRHLEKKCKSEIQYLKNKCSTKSTQKFSFPMSYDPSIVNESAFHIGDDPSDN